MIRRILILFAILILAVPSAGHAEDDPSQVIRQFCDQLLSVMKDGQKLGFAGREQKLQPAVAAAYDMPAMTKAMLGYSAGKLSPDELKKVSDAFDHYSVASYADQFDNWDGESFDVGAAKPSTEGKMIVPSAIIQKGGTRTEIDYLMHKADDGRWRIIDVLLDGTVSQVAVRRSEFVSIFRGSGASGLVDLLNRKTAAMGKT